MRTLAVSCAVIALSSLALGCSPIEPSEEGRGGSSKQDLLYVWAFDSDKQSSDFLAVVQADADADDYGEVIETVPVGLAGGAHHTEHRMPDDKIFFANAFAGGTTFLFDAGGPGTPRIAGSFRSRASFTFPHSFERLPSGNVLATFQNLGEGNVLAGGLVELDAAGKFVRGSEAADPADPELRPYSLVILPKIDRVVSTTADMRGQLRATSIQVWRLSDLQLLKTIQLPSGERGDENVMPAEPRALPDGETVIVNSFSCGLFMLSELDSLEPQARYLRNFPYQPPHRCALAVLAGSFWIQTVPTSEALVSLDLSDPTAPTVVQELKLGEDYRPHWISADQTQNRIVATGRGAMEHRVVLVSLDPKTGRMTIAPNGGGDLAGSAGIRFDRTDWPHGSTGPATPHGALYRH